MKRSQLKNLKYKQQLFYISSLQKLCVNNTFRRGLKSKENNNNNFSIKKENSGNIKLNNDLNIKNKNFQVTRTTQNSLLMNRYLEKISSLSLINKDEFSKELYFYNKKQNINMAMLDKIVGKILELLFSISSNPYEKTFNTQVKAIISKPNFKHINEYNSLDNKVVITFYLYLGKLKKLKNSSSLLTNKENNKASELRELCYDVKSDIFLNKLLLNIISISSRTKHKLFNKFITRRNTSNTAAPKYYINKNFFYNSLFIEKEQNFLPHNKIEKSVNKLTKIDNSLPEINYRILRDRLIKNPLSPIKNYKLFSYLSYLYVKRLEAEHRKGEASFSFVSLNFLQHGKNSAYNTSKYLEYFLANIYNKKIELNIIGIKKPYYNSEILSKNIAIFFDKMYLPYLKIKQRNLHYVIGILLNKINIINKLNTETKDVILLSRSSISTNSSLYNKDNIALERNLISSNKTTPFFYENNRNNLSVLAPVFIKSLISDKNHIKHYQRFDNIDKILYNFFLLNSNKDINIYTNNLCLKSNTKNLHQYSFNTLKEYVKTIITNSVKIKNIIGIRLYLSGRIAKRKIASRSRSYLFYKGSLHSGANTYTSLDHLQNYSGGFAAPRTSVNSSFKLGHINFNSDNKKIICTNKNGALSIKINIISG